jgi:outer membrane lipoprotein carrier protein
MWRILRILRIFGVIGLIAPAGGSAQSVDDLTHRIQSHLDGVQNFEARFTQRYHRRILGKVITESGLVAIKKPGRMRWDYTSPEEKVFVTDGEKTYFYLPEEKQVIVSQTPGGALGLTPDSPLSLLAGRSRLVEAFEVYPSQSAPQLGGTVLRLVPRRPQEDFEELEIEAETGGRVRRVGLEDSQGNRTDFIFTEIEENRDIPDTLFIFTVPSGVDIVTASHPQSGTINQEPKKP